MQKYQVFHVHVVEFVLCWPVTRNKSGEEEEKEEEKTHTLTLINFEVMEDKKGQN